LQILENEKSTKIVDNLLDWEKWIKKMTNPCAGLAILLF
jgi:hypothetical protein